MIVLQFKFSNKVNRINRIEYGFSEIRVVELLSLDKQIIGSLRL